MIIKCPLQVKHLAHFKLKENKSISHIGVSIQNDFNNYIKVYKAISDSRGNHRINELLCVILNNLICIIIIWMGCICAKTSTNSYNFYRKHFI